MIRSLAAAIAAVAIAVGATGCAGRRAALPQAEHVSVRSTNSIPFWLDGDQIVVSAKVNGAEAKLLLDTGATGVGFKASAAERLGVKADREAQAAGFGGTGAIQLGKARSIDVGSAISSNVHAAIIPLPPFFECDALLGLSFLSGFVCEIDFDRSRIAFHPASARLPSSVVLPLRIARGMIAAEAEVNGEKGHFVLDTGASHGLILNPTFLARTKLKDQFPKVVAVKTGIGVFGETAGELGRAPRLKIGSWTIQDVLAELSTQGMADDANIAGVIGMGTLIRFNLVIDIANRRLGLTPNEKYFASGRVSAFERTGMVLLPNACLEFVAQNVLPGSPAERAGVKVGDRLVEIDGNVVSKMRPNAVREAFRGEVGTAVRVRLQSGTGAVRDALIELGDAF